MYQRVLVCLDGSPFAEKALPTATALCQGWGGTLLLCRGVTPRTVPSLGPLPGQFAEDSLNSERDRAREYVESVAHGLPEGLDYQIVVKAGNLVHMLKEVVQEHSVELIVLATHQRHGFRRWLAGSTTEKLLREARCPLLSLPFEDGT